MVVFISNTYKINFLKPLLIFKDISVNSKCYTVKLFLWSTDNILVNVSISNIQYVCEYWAVDGTIILQLLCSGEFYEDWITEKKKVPVYAWFYAGGFALHFVMSIVLFFTKKKFAMTDHASNLMKQIKDNSRFLFF